MRNSAPFGDALFFIELNVGTQVELARKDARPPEPGGRSPANKRDRPNPSEDRPQ